MNLFSNNVSLVNLAHLAQFALSPDEQRKAKEAATRLKSNYNSELKKGKTREEIKAERDALRKKYPPTSKETQAAIRSEKIREEALGFNDPKRRQAFNEARATLKATQSKRAALNRQFRILNNPAASIEERQKAATELNKLVKDPRELEEIQKAFDVVAESRRTARSSKTAGGKNTIPKAGKKTAPEKALDYFNTRRDEFFISEPASSNIPDSYSSSQTGKTPASTTSSSSSSSTATATATSTASAASSTNPSTASSKTPANNTRSTVAAKVKQAANRIKNKGLNLYSRTNSFVRQNPLASAAILTGTGLALKGAYDAFKSRKDQYELEQLSPSDRSRYDDDDYRKYL